MDLHLASEPKCQAQRYPNGAQERTDKGESDSPGPEKAIREAGNHAKGHREGEYNTPEADDHASAAHVSPPAPLRMGITRHLAAHSHSIVAGGLLLMS